MWVKSVHEWANSSENNNESCEGCGTMNHMYGKFSSSLIFALFIFDRLKITMVVLNRVKFSKLIEFRKKNTKTTKSDSQPFRAPEKTSGMEF